MTWILAVLLVAGTALVVAEAITNEWNRED